jgi:hypothetical protein
MPCGPQPLATPPDWAHLRHEEGAAANPHLPAFL